MWNEYCITLVISYLQTGVLNIIGIHGKMFQIQTIKL